MLGDFVSEMVYKVKQVKWVQNFYWEYYIRFDVVLGGEAGVQEQGVELLIELGLQIGFRGFY